MGFIEEGRLANELFFELGGWIGVFYVLKSYMYIEMVHLTRNFSPLTVPFSSLFC